MKKFCLYAIFILTIMSTSFVSCSKQNSNVLNGHEYVDLGLPSGTKWATCNIGADNATMPGDYIAWGESTGRIYGKTNFQWDTYKLANGEDSMTVFNKRDGKLTLEGEYEIVSNIWGEGWKIPTKEQMKELVENCEWEWEKSDGVYGYKITGNNGKHIFLPAAGHYRKDKLKSENEEGGYWTSSVCAEGVQNAYKLTFDEDDKDIEQYARCYGQCIRPVCNPVNN